MYAEDSDFEKQNKNKQKKKSSDISNVRYTRHSFAEK